MLDVIHKPFQRVPHGWKWARLEDVCVGIFDCPHSTPLLSDTGPYLVRSQDIRTGVFIAEGVAHVSEMTYGERIARAEPRHGDILFSREGTYFGIAAEVPPDTRVCLGQRMVLLRPNPQLLNHRFLRYWLNSGIMAAHINGFRDGSVAERLNMPTIRALPVLVAPIEEQRNVARILGAFDDKIDLNRRMNDTLDATARAIFKSWFVDFDPTSSKSKGQQPASMGADIAALFPSQFSASSLGTVPSGWTVTAIGNVVRVVGGSTPRTEVPEYWVGGSIAWATPKDLAALTDPVLLDTERHVTNSGLAQISSGLLPAGTVLLSSRAPIGYLAISEVPVAVNQGFIAMVCDGVLPNHYILHWARANIEAITARANGTTFSEISKANFRPIEVLVPPAHVLKTFMDIVTPLYQRNVNNVRESQTLAAMRDTLLPKLMSGEVRVKQAEKVLQAVPV